MQLNGAPYNFIVEMQNVRESMPFNRSCHGDQAAGPISYRLAYVFHKILKILSKKHSQPHAPSSELTPYVELRKGVASVCL